MVISVGRELPSVTPPFLPFPPLPPPPSPLPPPPLFTYEPSENKGWCLWEVEEVIVLVGALQSIAVVEGEIE